MVRVVRVGVNGIYGRDKGDNYVSVKDKNQNVSGIYTK